MLLIPNYVYMKDYYIKLITSINHISSRMFYIVPNKRYLYTTPKGRRQEKSAKYTSPFPKFWFCHLPNINIYNKIINKNEYDSITHNNISININNINIDKNYKICKSISNLPNEVWTENDPRKKKQRNAEKRAKPKNRKKLKNSNNNSNNKNSYV